MSFAPYCGKLELNDRTHLWCEMEDGTIEIAPIENICAIHAEIFGEWAWSTMNRGYVFENDSVVSTHGEMSRALERKLERKLENVAYFFDESNYCL